MRIKEIYIDGNIVTNNNPMLNWYVNNVKLVTDRNGNGMPTKQNRYRKIDGFAAMLNSHCEYIRQNPLTGNGYSNEVITVIELE